MRRVGLLLRVVSDVAVTHHELVSQNWRVIPRVRGHSRPLEKPFGVGALLVVNDRIESSAIQIFKRAQLLRQRGTELQLVLRGVLLLLNIILLGFDLVDGDGLIGAVLHFLG